MTAPIHRVGIVAKQRLQGARDVLTGLHAWLAARNVEVVHDLDTADLSQQVTQFFPREPFVVDDDRAERFRRFPRHQAEILDGPSTNRGRPPDVEVARA